MHENAPPTQSQTYTHKSITMAWNVGGSPMNDYRKRVCAVHRTVSACKYTRVTSKTCTYNVAYNIASRPEDHRMIRDSRQKISEFGILFIGLSNKITKEKRWNCLTCKKAFMHNLNSNVLSIEPGRGTGSYDVTAY
jgi:hypothetical protein